MGIPKLRKTAQKFLVFLNSFPVVIKASLTFRLSSTGLLIDWFLIKQNHVVYEDIIPEKC